MADKVNRFNKKKFNDHMLKLINNNDFKFEVSRFSKGELKLHEIMPTKEFRKWCKKLLIQAGMDKKEVVDLLISIAKNLILNQFRVFMSSLLVLYIHTWKKVISLTLYQHQILKVVSIFPKYQRQRKLLSTIHLRIDHL